MIGAIQCTNRVKFYESVANQTSWLFCQWYDWFYDSTDKIFIEPFSSSRRSNLLSYRPTRARRMLKPAVWMLSHRNWISRHTHEDAEPLERFSSLHESFAASADCLVALEPSRPRIAERLSREVPHCLWADLDSIENQHYGHVLKSQWFDVPVHLFPFCHSESLLCRTAVMPAGSSWNGLCCDSAGNQRWTQSPTVQPSIVIPIRSSFPGVDRWLFSLQGKPREIPLNLTQNSNKTHVNSCQ